MNFHAKQGIHEVKKPLYQPLPFILEDLDTLQARLHRERDPKRKPPLHLLVLLKSGQVTSRGQAAAHLALRRNTVAAWLRRDRDGGLEALLTYKEAGAPAGQKTLPPAVFEQLQTHLATSPGFASYLDVQRWLREEFALEVPYKTLHGIVHYLSFPKTGNIYKSTSSEYIPPHSMSVVDTVDEMFHTVFVGLLSLASSPIST